MKVMGRKVGYTYLLRCFERIMEGAWDLDWWIWVMNFSWPNSQNKMT
jgi:hypothetical protein